ncbi:MAG: flagellar filament outer layer protein FlaA [Spirochaetaceae bacterium]|jgi:hypothetical protein|nr:flagellar filament outer layer protein FlaA [Spirochaetaceae bacterium]
MKKGSLTAIFSLLFLGSAAVSAFADGNTVEITSRILENFDGSPYVVDGEEYRYTWQAVGSKYTTKTDDQSFPQVAVVNTAPLTLERLAGEAGAKSLGVQGSFSRSGFNWIDIYPTASGGEGQPVEIPLLGRTRAIDVWVWGSNLNYYLEAYIRDNRGMVHVIPLGSLRYLGWKNLRSNIPESIPMISSQVPRSTHAVTFVKFRLWTEPNEKTFLSVEHDATTGKVTKVVPFYLYIAQLKALTDVYETIYDGDTLANPKTVNELWAAGGAEAAPNNQAGNNQ